MAHIHSVYDADTHFTIDPITRKISNAASKKYGVVQFDHNSERFTFELPRYIEGHDMSLCNNTEVHYINIGADGEKAEGVYPVDDIQISPADENVVICSWLISANATKLAGTLSFMIRFACLTDNVVDYAWHTMTYTGFTISEGMNNGEAVMDVPVDVLEAWRKEILADVEDAAKRAETAAEDAVKRAEAITANVDDELSETSTNPIQNKAVAKALSGISVDAPSFDLVALGLPTITIDQPAMIEIDTAAITAALDKGAAKFIVALNMGATVQVEALMNGISANGEYICSYAVDFNGVQLILTLAIMEGAISGYIAEMASGNGLPEVTTADNNKVLCVVGGAWAAVALTDVSEEGA